VTAAQQQAPTAEPYPLMVGPAELDQVFGTDAVFKVRSSKPGGGCWMRVTFSTEDVAEVPR
jgi:hypothetical protein